MPGEITREHLSRIAYIYIRQSSQRQVEKHSSGRQVQYNLVQRAKSLGWTDKISKLLTKTVALAPVGRKNAPALRSC